MAGETMVTVLIFSRKTEAINKDFAKLAHFTLHIYHTRSSKCLGVFNIELQFGGGGEGINSSSHLALAVGGVTR